MTSPALYYQPPGFRATFGLQILENRLLRRGDVLIDRTRNVVYVGTREPTDIEWAGIDARRQVRHGLKHVLAWLGQTPGLEPGDRSLPTLAEAIVRAQD